MKGFNIQNLVFIDESGFQNNMTRLYGRIIGGKRLRDYVPCGNWNTTTMISSIRFNAEMASMTVEGATDAEAFQAYITEILCPSLKKGDTVIMDNLSSHKVSGIREAIESRGASLLYLPPYSPDYNPIEMMWSKVKTFLRKVKARTHDELMEAISKAFGTITSSDAESWFASCGYVLIHS